MNVLVTNTRAAQSYFVIRALRPYATKMVATMYGNNRPMGWSCHAAQSRLVDRRYHVPSPAGDWKIGNVTKHNSPKEEAYIQEILRICEVEQIDTVFPSWDAQNYVFSKNKERFNTMGVLIPIPDFETYKVLLDKYQTILLAQQAGFACPKTYLPQSLNDLEWIASELNFPVTIKPRFASWGIEFATDRSVLLEKTRRLANGYGMPMIQEFVPGVERQDLHFILDKRGELKLACYRSVHRSLRLDPHAHFATVNEVTDSRPFPPEATGFLHKLGWWGSGTLETVIDPRDGKAKFAELIPRFRRQLWNTTELGINEPWICIQIARDQPVEPIKNCPAGTMFVNPIEDVVVLIFQLLDLLIYKFKRKVGQRSVDPLDAPQPLKELLKCFTRTYLCRKPKLLDPYFRYFFRDPLVSLLWWLQLSAWVLRMARQLGR